jgi:8-oxo-dGTP pyrophosphatase MutT (NUDIX family)
MLEGLSFLELNKLVLQREPRTGKTWFPAGSVTANEEPTDDAVRELHEETCLILTPDDLTLFSDAHVRVALPVGHQHARLRLLGFKYMFRTLRPNCVLMLSSSILIQLSRLLIRMALTSSRKQSISVV